MPGSNTGPSFMPARVGTQKACTPLPRGSRIAKRSIRHGAVKPCVGHTSPTNVLPPGSISFSGSAPSSGTTRTSVPAHLNSAAIHSAARKEFPVPLRK